VARGTQPSSGAGARSGGAAASGSRQRTPRPETPRQRTQSIPEDTYRRMSGKKVALVAVPLLLIAVGGAFIALRPSTPTEAPPRPPPADTKGPPTAEQKPPAPAVDSMILVQLRSTPTGATVFDEDVQIGTTPLDRPLRRNEAHELTFRLAAHQEVKRKLDFTGVLTDTQEVSVTLEPVKPTPTVDASPRPSRPAKPQVKDKEKDDIAVFE
jgi:eukaryotic-like serine/threonine-protein kinase